MSVKSAVRVVRIFELLSNHPDGLTVKDSNLNQFCPQPVTLDSILLKVTFIQKCSGQIECTALRQRKFFADFRCQPIKKP